MGKRGTGKKKNQLPLVCPITHQKKKKGYTSH